MLTIATGPPCSGKTSYIRDSAKPGDIVIDLDRIAQALGAEGVAMHDYPEHVRLVARRARIAAIDAALLQHAAGRRVWIVDAAPSKEQRIFYHRRNAKFVALTVSPALLSQRLASRPLSNQAFVTSLTGITAADVTDSERI